MPGLSSRSLAAALFIILGGSVAGCAVADSNTDVPDAFPSRPDGGGTGSDAMPQPPDAGGPSACDMALQNLRFDFEGGAQGFVHNRMPEVASSTVNWTFDHWEQGAASAGIACNSGQECFGTNLDGNYIQCQRAYLVSPPVDLSSCAAESRDLSVLFEHRYDFWTGNEGGPKFDGGLVEISGDGTNWQSATLLYPGTIDINPAISSASCVEQNNFYASGKSGYVGTSGGWKNESFSIPSSLQTVTFQVRFVYAAGVSSQTTDQVQSMLGTASGWFVDNLRFE